MTDIFDEMTRITKTHCEIMGYTKPDNGIDPQSPLYQSLLKRNQPSPNETGLQDYYYELDQRRIRREIESEERHNDPRRR